MSNNSPIGVFDSGVGGLSVWREIVKILPSENIIYFADSKNCPYGTKTDEEIINLSRKIVDFLISQNCKIIVVACNTATAAAISTLRKEYNLPFVGMEPAVKPAAINTKNKKIGVLATEGTIRGSHLKKTTEIYAKDTQVFVQIGEGLVELVESNNIYSDKAIKTLNKCIKPLIDKEIDQLVLGCTHYPFLCKLIKQIDGMENVDIINPAPAVALRTLELIKYTLNTENENYYHFYTSGSILQLKNTLSIIENIDYNKVKIYKTNP
jgi:glutamate racemase